MNNEPTTSRNKESAGDPGHLDWLAFRYVADELDDDERVAFEASLADDQAAREAVEQAVVLGQAAWQAFANTDGKNGRRVLPARAGAVAGHRSRKPFWVLASALALVIAAGWIVTKLPGDRLGDGTESDLVAVAWAEVVSNSSEIESPEFTDADFETELTGTPDADWMLVALTEMSGAPNGEDRDDTEEIRQVKESEDE